MKLWSSSVDYETKYCRLCKFPKTDNEFAVRNDKGKSYILSICKSCNVEQNNGKTSKIKINKEYKEPSFPEGAETNHCKKCHNTKIISDFRLQRNTCKKCESTNRMKKEIIVNTSCPCFV